MKNNLKYLFVSLVCFLFLVSCIKDTDFNQADQITANPVVELDFIHFNLNESDYQNIDTGEYQLMVTDTTELKFLDDDFSRQNIKRAEFYFNFNNSFPTTFLTQFQFLNPNNNVVKYQVDIPINAGSISNPVSTEYLEIVENNDINNLTKAEKVVINVIAPSSLQNIEGTLELKSKQTFYLEF